MPLVLFITAVLLLGALALQGWVLLHLRGQHDRVERRLDTLTRRHASRTAGAVTGLRGRQAPSFELATLDGDRLSLARLAAAAKPVLLVFTDPRCGPCYERPPDVGGWQRVYGDRLTIALVSEGTIETNQAMTAEYGIRTVLLQAESEVAEAFGVTMMPAAAVISPDGRFSGGLAYGAPQVRELVAAMLGLVVPEPPAREMRAVSVGQRAPAVRRPDLDGNVVELAAGRGEATLLLFWSPGCHHCQDLLPAMRAWEAQPDGPRLLVVSRGPVELNKEAGLRSPMLLDDDHAIADLFGVTGAPAAIVIDAMGFVASHVARGATAVRALAAHRFAPRAVATG